jgi:hypothetical protein
MPSTDKMVRAEIRRLARKGKLIDEAFKVFQRSVYPGAPPDQVACMRTCFFAGAAEIFALITTGSDEGDEITNGDLDLMSQWVDEIERFHQRTIDTMGADGRHN